MSLSTHLLVDLGVLPLERPPGDIVALDKLGQTAKLLRRLLHLGVQAIPHRVVLLAEHRADQVLPERAQVVDYTLRVGYVAHALVRVLRRVDVTDVGGVGTPRRVEYVAVYRSFRPSGAINSYG